jgi:hypothetical protein
MGFKINKGKSWKNLGKKTAKKTFSKKNMSSIDKTWDNTTKSIKSDISKTTKAAGKGIKRGMDDMAGNMTTWLIIGAVAVGGVFVLTNDTGGSRNN